MKTQLRRHGAGPRKNESATTGAVSSTVPSFRHESTGNGSCIADEIDTELVRFEECDFTYAIFVL